MIGTTKVGVLVLQKDNLYQYSLNYAKFDRPDFILLKEALLAYEKIIAHQQLAHKNEPIASIGDQDKKYLFSLLNVVINTYGTDDTEWFCATETILNTLFNLKTRNSPEYAKTLIQNLTKKLYSDKKRSNNISLDEENKVMNDGGDFENFNNDQECNGNPLRTDITDMHYAQLFFVVGHTAIKMLTYVE